MVLHFSVQLPGFDLAIHKTMGFDGIVCSECLFTVRFRVYTAFTYGISARFVVFVWRDGHQSG